MFNTISVTGMPTDLFDFTEAVSVHGRVFLRFLRKSSALTFCSSPPKIRHKSHFMSILDMLQQAVITEEVT